MGVRLRLGLASALMLFLELSLIRWLGANLVHLAYFSNFVLLGSFLGVGLGFLRASRDGLPERPQPYYSLVVLLGLIAFVSAYPVTVDRQSSQVVFFTSVHTTGPPIWLVLPAVFLSVAVILAGPAEIVGGCFRVLPRLDAYRFDLLGSLGGIVAFTLLSWFDSPPLVWFAIVGVLFVVLLGRAGSGVSVALLVALAVMFTYPLSHDKGVFWSPYYKVSTQPLSDGLGGAAYSVSVNGVPHQRLTSVAARAKLEPSYLQPYRSIAHRSRPGSHRRRGHRHRRGHRPEPGRHACRRGRDRPDAAAFRSPARPRPRLSGSPGERAHRRRAGVPAAVLAEVQPDPVRAARLPHPGIGSKLAAPGELPVHPAGGAVRARSPGAGRRVRDVQLLPAAMAGRPAGRNP